MIKPILLGVLSGLALGSPLGAVVDRPPKARPDPAAAALLAAVDRATAILDMVHDQETAERALAELPVRAREIQDLANGLRRSAARTGARGEPLLQLQITLMEARKRWRDKMMELRRGPVINEVTPAVYIRLLRSFRDLDRSLRTFNRLARGAAP